MIDSIKFYENKKWLLLFYQDLTNNEGLFSNDWDSFLFIETDYKYSILGKLDESFKYHNRFEFLLYYPELVGHNIWTQTKNPIETEVEGENGFKPVDLTWPDQFAGLSKSNYTDTFLDARRDSYFWYFAIGQKNYWHDSLAGPLVWNDLNPTPIFQASLYIRIDHTNTIFCQNKLVKIIQPFTLICIFSILK